METLLVKFVINGGPMMVLLIPCSIVTLAAILQHMIRLRRGRVLPVRIRRLLRGEGDVNDRRAGIEGLRDHPSPLAQAIWLTLRKFHLDAKRPDQGRLETQMDVAMVRVGDQMHEGLGVLSTLYTIAPLLGLMGTILGMMNTFYDFAVAQEKSVQLLSIGIQEALVTTLWGLGIAIPAFVATQWLDSIITAYERRRLPAAATRVIQHLFAADAVATPSDAEAGEPSGTFEETGDPPPNPGPQPPDSGHRADSEPQR